MSAIVSLLPLSWQPKAKYVVAVIGAVLGVLSIAFADAPWLAVVVQIATAAGVYAVPNLPKPAPEPVNSEGV